MNSGSESSSAETGRVMGLSTGGESPRTRKGNPEEGLEES